MKIKPDSNNCKILLALIEANRSLSVKILAENTGIPYKNIHRNLKQLFDGKFIDKLVSQEGRNRYTYISLTPKGSDFELCLTIDKPEPSIEAKMEANIEEYEKYYSKSLKDARLSFYSAPESYGETLKFGIRFFSWFARELEIPNYSKLRLNELKFEIGFKLIDESELANTKTISEPLTLNDIELLDGE